MRFAAIFLCLLMALPARSVLSGGNAELPEWPEWSGMFSPHSEFTAEVIRGADAWNDLWALLHQPPPPEFDPARHMALAVFLGLRNTGGFDLTIERVTENIFRVREIPPAADSMVAQVMTNPFRIIVMPLRGGPVYFLLAGPAGECLYISAGERARAEPLSTAIKECRR